MVGGVPLEAIIDTGASTLTLPREVAEKLVEQHGADGKGFMQSTLADGSGGPSVVLTVHTIEIGDHVLRDVKSR